MNTNLFSKTLSIGNCITIIITPLIFLNVYFSKFSYSNIEYAVGAGIEGTVKVCQ